MNVWLMFDLQKYVNWLCVFSKVNPFFQKAQVFCMDLWIAWWVSSRATDATCCWLLGKNVRNTASSMMIFLYFATWMLFSRMFPKQSRLISTWQWPHFVGCLDHGVDLSFFGPIFDHNILILSTTVRLIIANDLAGGVQAMRYMTKSWRYFTSSHASTSSSSPSHTQSRSAPFLNYIIWIDEQWWPSPTQQRLAQIYLVQTCTSASVSFQKLLGNENHAVMHGQVQEDHRYCLSLVLDACLFVKCPFRFSFLFFVLILILIFIF